MSAAEDRTPAGGASGEIDEITLARARRGDEPARRALVDRYQRPVFALLSRMLAPRGHDRVLVEDLAQETFLRVFRELARFDPRGRARISTWILTIATRLAIDELRRRPPGDTIDAELAAAPPGLRPDERAARSREAAAIYRAVAGLSPEQRAAFLLREAHGLSYDELARVLGVGGGTVKSRLARAKAALRRALAEVEK